MIHVQIDGHPILSGDFGIWHAPNNSHLVIAAEQGTMPEDLRVELLYERASISLKATTSLDMPRTKEMEEVPRRLALGRGADGEAGVADTVGDRSRHHHGFRTGKHSPTSEPFSRDAAGLDSSTYFDDLCVPITKDWILNTPGNHCHF